MSEKEPEIMPTPSVDEGQLAAEKQMRDIGAELYLEVRQYSREELDAERKKVLRKIDRVIMPMVRHSETFKSTKSPKDVMVYFSSGSWRTFFGRDRK